MFKSWWELETSSLFTGSWVSRTYEAAIESFMNRPIKIYLWAILLWMSIPSVKIGHNFICCWRLSRPKCIFLLDFKWYFWFQDYDYPMISNENMPQTSFSCKDKVNGGYYADIETMCQMYHVCSRDRFGYMRSTRFLCGNGTVFDQRHLVCQDYKGIRCKESEKYYRHPTPWRFWSYG